MNRCDKCKCAECGDGSLHFCCKLCAIDYVFAITMDDPIWCSGSFTVGQDVELEAQQ